MLLDRFVLLTGRYKKFIIKMFAFNHVNYTFGKITAILDEVNNRKCLLRIKK